MAGIIITPGTFNPPATPAQTPGVLAFPRAKDKTLRTPWEQLQWSTRRAEPLAEPGYPVIYMYRDLMAYELDTGLLVVGLDPEDVWVDSSREGFVGNRIRYAQIADYYPITFADLENNRYAADAPILYVPQPSSGTPEFPSAAYPGITSIEIGAHTIEQGGSPLSGYSIPIYLGYDIEVEGTDDDGTYEVLVLDNHFSGEDHPPGELLLRLQVEAGPGPTYENEIEVDHTLTFSAILKRDGVIIDKIYMAVQVTGHISVLPIDDFGSLTPPPEVITTEVMEEVLYGKTADFAISRQPTIRATVGYARESWIKQGRIILA